MDKQLVGRRRLAAAAAAVALAGLGVSESQATLTLDLRTTTGGKTANVSAAGTVTLDLYAQITGGDASGNNDGVQEVFASVLSANGGLLGNLSPLALTTRFQGSGSSPGTPTDLDSPTPDGDLDLGSNTNSDATGFAFARSGTPTFVASGTGTVTGGTYEVKLGSVTFTQTGGTGSTTVNARPRTATSGALWWEDAVETPPPAGSPPGTPSTYSNQKDGGSGTIALGTPVTITLGGGGGTPNLWGSTGGGSYGDGTKWSDSNVPASGANVTFGGSITAPSTVTLDAARTVGGLTFDNANAYTLSAGTGGSLAVNAGATIAVPQGNHTITAPVTFAGAVTKTGAGGIALPNVRATSLTISGGKVTITPNDGTSAGRTAGASKAALTLSGGTLDLKNNNMVDVGASAATVRGQIGTGVITTTGALPAQFAGKTAAVGYAQGNDPGIASGFAGSLNGQSFTGTDVILKFTLAGDADLDGDVDLDDIGPWSNNFTGSKAAGTGTSVWTQGDWDYDADIDLDDVGVWSNNFSGSLAFNSVLDLPGAQPVAVKALESMGFTVVPEPASLGLIGLAGLAMGRRRRK